MASRSRLGAFVIRFRHIRSVFKWCLAGLIGLVALVLCCDWWLPSVLPTILKQWDVRVASITEMEPGRWELTDVRYVADGVEVTSAAVRVPSVRRSFQAYWQGDVAELLVEVSALRVVLLPSEKASAETAEFDLLGMLGEVRSAMSAYEAWIPAVEIESAEIVSDEARVLTLQDVSLRDWQLAGRVGSEAFALSVAVEADLSPVETWVMHLNVSELGLLADATLNFEVADRVSLQLSVMQGDETLGGQAVWRSGAPLPSEVRLMSDRFSIQSSWFSDFVTMRAERLWVSDLNVSWGEEHYHGNLLLTAELPVEDHGVLPLEALVSVSGDFETLRVETCNVSGAWGALVLSNALEIDLRERAVLQGAELTASLDLEQQPWIPAQGHLDGVVRVEPDPADGFDLKFDLNGVNLSYDGYAADGVRLAGEVQGSAITLEQLQLDLLGDTEADRVMISGVANVAERIMDLKYEAALGADWLNAQLGEEYFADALAGTGRVFGSFDDPELEGTLEPVTVLHPLLHPVRLAGEVRSLSEGAIDIDLSAQCEGAEVLLDLAAQRRDGVCSVEFQQFVISDPELPTVQLLKPARITYRTAEELGERLRVEPFDLESEDSAAHVSWHAAEGFSLVIRNMSSTRVARWLKQDLPAHQIDSVDVALTQLQPKILGRVEMHAQGEVSEGEVLRVDLVSRIEQQGVVLEQLAVNFEEESLLAGALALPIRLQLPHDEVPLWVGISGGHLSGELKGQTTADFSQWLSEQCGVTFGEASLALSLSGFWAQPLGALDLHVAGADFGSHFPKVELPKFTDLAIVARIGVDTWAIERFECLLNQSQVAGAIGLPTADVLEALGAWPLGAWPLGAIDWKSLSQHASGRIELKDWKFADWRHRFPEVMRDSGELNGELVLKPELDLSGRLVLDDFALRPTQAYSMIDQIGAELELSDRVIQVNHASARVGGSPLTLKGWVDGSDLSEPLWEVSAAGEHVPLVRTSDLILRSDVDLTLKRLHAEDVAELSGELNFTPSTLLVEFDPFAPRVQGGRSSQPPYFSITTPAIADWKFDVVGKGDAFLRVRSPYCRALVSANLTLGGTFIKPELLGHLRVASGDVLFPSVKMDLDNGEAYIERTRPHEVQLDFSGIAQVSSYVITMEVSQSLTDPSVLFSSTPNLPSSEIVRLLATGGISGGEVGAVGVYLGKGLLGIGAGGVDSSLADRLTIDVGEAGGRDGGNTFGVQYRLTDDLSLKGGYDIHEAYNLDLLWSIFKR